MNISSIKPNGYSLPPAPALPPEEAAQRQKLVQAAKSINTSGIFGHDQLVFMVDRATRRPIIRVVDRTHTRCCCSYRLSMSCDWPRIWARAPIQPNLPPIRK